MNLIEEIESAAEAWGTQQQPSAFFKLKAAQLIDAPFWPRIKAALESAKEMDETLTSQRSMPGMYPWPSQINFRAAMEGKE